MCAITDHVFYHFVDACVSVSSSVYPSAYLSAHSFAHPSVVEEEEDTFI